MRSLKNPRKGPVFHALGKIPALPSDRQVWHGGGGAIWGSEQLAPAAGGSPHFLISLQGTLYIRSPQDLTNFFRAYWHKERSMKNGYLLVSIFLTLALTACGAGEQGPQGPEGKQGPKGFKGDAGSDGQPG